MAHPPPPEPHAPHRLYALSTDGSCLRADGGSCWLAVGVRNSRASRTDGLVPRGRASATEAARSPAMKTARGAMRQRWRAILILVTSSCSAPKQSYSVSASAESSPDIAPCWQRESPQECDSD